MTSRYFENKVVWLTGASSGIGEALSPQLAARGASLVLSARQTDALEGVKSASKNADRHLVLSLDLLAPAEFPAAAERVLKQFSRIDILINCAGISQRANAVDTDMKVDRHLMELNYFGPIALTKLVLPGMIARRDGQIVVISSLMGKLSLPARSAYAASKHALHGFYDSLRAEVADDGIAVTVICPGYIRTNAAFNALNADGTPANKMDSDIAGGLDPAVCAQKIIRAIERRRAEVDIARYEKLGIYINRFAPALFRRIARGKARRRK